MGFSGPSWHNSKTWNFLMTWSPQMQYRTTRLESKFLATRLRLSWGKANLTTTNTATNIPQSVLGEPSEKSTLLPILAALWIKRAAETSLPVREGKTRAAFITLKNIWASKKIAIITKLCTLNANVKSILPYKSEKGRMTFSRSEGKSNCKKLGAVRERIARTSKKTDPEA